MLGKLILIIGVFLLGLYATSIYAAIAPENPINLELPLADKDKDHPANRILEDQIHVFKDRIVIDLADAQWSYFADTKSMEPVIFAGANAIQVVPDCPDGVQIGDIISYDSEFSDGVIIHRVVHKDEDEEGTYFIMKGDNNPTSDPGRVRCDQIKRTVVMLVY
ncbi:MAG: signal peptidase I [archaeon]